MGGFFASTLGGIVLGVAGALIDNLLFKPKVPDGPRLDDLGYQGSNYGAFLNRVHGTTRCSGTVIWAPKLIEEKTKVDSGGKGGMFGGSSQKVYKYYAHFALAICEDAADILTIWFDNKIVYDVSEEAETRISKVKGARDMRIHQGLPDQLPDGLIVSYEGANTPAYRGLTTIVFERLALENYGNRIPNVQVAVSRGATRFGLSHVSSVAAPASTGQGVGGPYRVASGDIVTIGFTGQKFRAAHYASNGKSLIAAYDSTNMPRGGFAVTSVMDPTGRYILAVNRGGMVGLYDSTAHAWYWKNTYASNFIFDGIIFQPGGEYVSLLASLGNAITLARVGNDLVQQARFGSLPFIQSSGRNAFATADGVHIVNFTNQTQTGDDYKATLSTRLLTMNALGSVITGPVFTTKNWWAMEARALILPEGTLQADGTILSDGRAMVWWRQTEDDNTDQWYAQLFRFFSTSMVADSPIVQIPRLPVVDESPFPIPEMFWPQVMQSGLIGILCGTQGGGSRWYMELSYQPGALAIRQSWIEVPTVIEDGYGTSLNTVALDNGGFLSTDISGLAQYQVYVQSERTSIAAILTEEMTRTGMTAGDFDVSTLENDEIYGLCINAETTSRQVWEMMQQVVFFDAIESAGIIRAVRRKGAVDLTIEDGMTGADGEPAYELTRIPDADIPRMITLDYMSTDDDYNRGAQYAVRTAASNDARSDKKTTLPIAMSDTAALRIAETMLHAAANERLQVKLTIPRSFSELEPGDILGWRSMPVRINRLTMTGTRLELEGTTAYLPAYSSDAIAPDRPPIRPATPQPTATELDILQIPALRAAEDQPGYYFATYNESSDWPGADLIRSADQQTWENLQGTGNVAVRGTVTAAMGLGPTDMWDEKTVVTVNLDVGDTALQSYSADDILSSDSNLAMIGDELIQFRTATLVGDRLWTLSGLLRGRKGTDAAIGTHAANELFYLVNTTALSFQPVPLTEAFRSYSYRAVTVGLDQDQANTVTGVYGIDTILPLAPVRVEGVRDEDGNWNLSWNRRARYGGEWIDRIDVPLDETAEEYELEFLLGGEVVHREAKIMQPYVTYMVEDQIADYGSVRESFDMRVYQVSARAGVGHPATAHIS
jgi:hypothetical protein